MIRAFVGNLLNSAFISPACGLRPGLIRCAAWLCIATQALFPVATSVAAVAATSHRDSPSTPLVLNDQRTTVYVLGPLESAQSVADRYGITLSALRQLNAFRTFSRGFENVRQGDEIDVPWLLPSGQASSDALSSDFRNIDQHALEGQVAGVAQRAGSLLSQGVTGRQVAGMARGYVTGTASAAVSNWLSQFGTARVALNSDEAFSLKGSRADLLLAWYDTPDSLFFTQHSFHHTDDRSQLNSGAGWRYFSPTYMTGLNLFYDHDLTRYHSRLGLGGEYWRDWFKLSGNGYLHLSSWRSAPELNHDYVARPANGWDIRMEGWIPAYPHIGGKLTFEQYYGDEVALFGKNRRQKDPYAFTTGLSWTPFPLMTFGAEHSRGKGKENDTRFDVGLTWQLGMSLAQQLDPDVVSSRRSLSGSRYDLIERNNNIVLEYRKKDLVKLRLSDPVRGKSGEQKPLVTGLQTKYPLKTLYTDMGTLVAAGGSYIINGSQVTVTLPAYRYTQMPETDNSYVVYVTAEDAKGNRSRRESSTIIVEAPVLNPAASMASIEPVKLTADGRSTAVLTYRAEDGRGNGIPGLKPGVRIIYGEGKGAETRAVELVTVEAFTDKGNGTYEAVVTAGSRPGTVKLMPRVNNTDAAREAASLLLDVGTAVAERSELRTDKSAYTAGDTIEVTVTLKDAQGNPVTGQSGELAAVTVGGAESQSVAWKDNDDGSYTGKYLAKEAGAWQAKLQLTGWSGALEAEYSISAGTAVAEKSELRTDKSAYTAGDTIEVTVTLKDAQGNPVTGQSGELAAVTVGGTESQSVAWKDNDDGSYTGKYLAKKAGAWQAKLQLTGWSGALTEEYSISAGTAVAGNSSITTDKANYYAEGKAAIFVTLQDSYHNSVSDMSSTLNSYVTVDQSALIEPWQETSPGEYTAKYKLPDSYGSGLAAKLLLDGWGESLTASFGLWKLTGVYTNDYMFNLTDGFPSTGYESATFSLVFNETINSIPPGWQLTADSATISINKTSVTLLKKNSGSVNIYLNEGEGPKQLYNYRISAWFAPQRIDLPLSEAENNCISHNMQLAHVNSLISGGQRGVGALFNEYGSMSMGQGTVRGFDVWVKNDNPSYNEIRVDFSGNSISSSLVYEIPIYPLWSVCSE